MSFKIPSRLRVVGIDYKILWKDDIRDGNDNEMCGVCSEHLGEIYLSRHLLKTDDQIILTFLHEVTHALLHNVPFDHFLDPDVDPRDFTEYLTEGIARTALAIIKDNRYEKTDIFTNKKNFKHTPRNVCAGK